jgi:hypothetical protein
MPKKPTVSVEIMRKPSPEDWKALLDRMVTDKVEQILAERDLEQLAPTYRSSRIRPIHPGFERVKHGLWFEKHGCEICGRKNDVSHMGKGRCGRCNSRYHQRMAALECKWISENPDSEILENIDHLTRRLRTARELLAEGADGLSHSQAVSAYRTHNIAAGKCAYCPNPLAPNSTHYCVECLRKKRDRKRKKREDFKARLHAGRSLVVPAQ